MSVPESELHELVSRTHGDLIVRPADVVIVVTALHGVVEAWQWPIPADLDDPHACLVGWVAPPHVEAVGLSILAPDTPDPKHAGGRQQPDLAVPDRRWTTLVTRDGLVVALSGYAGDERRRPAPFPSTLDVLGRSLGLSTPKPPVEVSYWLDCCWLDNILAAVLVASRSLGVDDLLDAHPLRELVPDARTPTELRAAVETYTATTSWAMVRESWTEPPLDAHPPDGDLIRPADWFDDGSFARWQFARLRSIGELLGDLDVLLPAHLVQAVVDGLSTDV